MAKTTKTLTAQLAEKEVEVERLTIDAGITAEREKSARLVEVEKDRDTWRQRAVDTRTDLTERVRVLEEEAVETNEALVRVVNAMELWGSWEDGIPETGDGAYGSVGSAYENAKDLIRDPATPPEREPSPKFPETWCSQCGQPQGPGDNGFSHCEDHPTPKESDHEA